MSKSVGIVILARYSSSRLPGKALMEIAGKKVLQHIIDRVSSIVPKEKIILATSLLPSDDALVDFVKELGLQCHRGSLERVGERFYEAARQLEVDFAVRMNGDNIFLDPEMLGLLIENAGAGEYNFLSNVNGRTFPKGMSVEVVALDYYEQHLDQIRNDAYCNEHVMVCLYKEPVPRDHFYLKNEQLPQAAGIQLALDTPEDLERSRWMLERMPLGRYDLKTTFEYFRRYEESVKG